MSSKTTWRQVISSVLAAFFGVQSFKNHQRDFNKGSPIMFVITGLVMTCIFVLSIMLIVKMVLP